MENTKYVLDAAKSAAITTSTLCIGAAIMATQLTLALGVAGANLILDSLIASKRIGSSMLTCAKVCFSALFSVVLTQGVDLNISSVFMVVFNCLLCFCCYELCTIQNPSTKKGRSAAC